MRINNIISYHPCISRNVRVMYESSQRAEDYTRDHMVLQGSLLGVQDSKTLKFHDLKERFIYVFQLRCAFELLCFKLY